MTDLFIELANIRKQGGRATLATIIATAGSTPGKEAMKLLVRSDGSFAGTVGGGCLESEVLEVARAVLGGAPPQVLQFRLNERDYPDSGLLCGGMVTVLVESVDEPADFFNEILNLRDAGISMARVCAITKTPESIGRQRLIARSGVDRGGLRHPAFDDILLKCAGEVMRTDRPARIELTMPGAPPIEAFVEPVVAPLILIFGGGHVSGAIARVAHAADFRTIIIDDREIFASKERHPDAADVLCLDWESAVGRFAPATDARCIVVTRGHHDDERVLREMAARGCDPAYIGMIGSRTKQILVFEKLREAGVSPDFIQKIKTPIGLDIGARTHAEIAISVVAELIQLRRKGSL